MILTVNKPTNVDVKYLYIHCGGRLDYNEFTLESGNEKENFEDLFELLEKYPSLGIGSELYFKVDVDTGEVVNFPKGKSLDCYNWKIVDDGTYIVTDIYNNTIAEYRGYVPDFLGPNGYGDYFEFEIENGFIKNWKFTQENLEEIINYGKE